MDELQDIENRYKRNVDSLPWTPQMKANYETNYLTNYKQTIEQNLNNGSALVENVVKNVDGSRQKLESTRSTVNLFLTNIQSANNTLAKLIKQIMIEPVEKQIMEIKKMIYDETLRQSKTDTLLKIRKEQTAALNQKYASNLHSSWLGLWRPLQDQSRAILATAAVVFGLLTVVIAAYFSFGAVKGLIAGRGGGGGSGASAAVNIGSLTNYMNNNIQETNEAIRNFVGGVRSRK